MIEELFQPFPKIHRLSKGWVVTEKLDGTNAQVIITEDGQVHAASRNRLITVENDNFGFARFVEENKQDLLKLGEGRHYGEWYGSGIQRGYGLRERRFALFNTHRWSLLEDRPACCDVVPVISQFDYLEDFTVFDNIMKELKEYGSYAETGFMNPEGIVAFHAPSRTMFKKTFEYDLDGKGRVSFHSVNAILTD